MTQTEVVIVSAVRTALGNFNGSLKNVSAPELGATVIKGALEQAGLKPEQVDEVILGNVLQAGLGQNPARQAAISAGIPESVSSMTINKVCGSGLKAVHLATQAILAGDAEIVVAGGMENMSQAPYLIKNARDGFKMGDQKLIDTLTSDGLTCVFNQYHMGVTAENLADKYSITREEQDQFSAWSQEKAVKAIEAGTFKDEIVPVVIPQRKGDPIVFDTDEYPKKDQQLKNLQDYVQHSEKMAA